MNPVDTLFASCFAFATIASIVAISLMTMQLPTIEDARVIMNSRISSKAIGVFFIAMVAMVVLFAVKGLIITAFSTLILATVGAVLLQRHSNRATLILRRRHYI